MDKQPSMSKILGDHEQMVAISPRLIIYPLESKASVQKYGHSLTPNEGAGTEGLPLYLRMCFSFYQYLPISASPTEAIEAHFFRNARMGHRIGGYLPIDKSTFPTQLFYLSTLRSQSLELKFGWIKLNS